MAHVPGRVAAMPGADLSREEMAAWGESFGARLTAPCVVTLSGDLGTGKTTLAQAICRGYGVQDAVTSPTFGVVHEYASARTPVLHLDLFRLQGPQELAAIGWEEALARPALVLIEWPERAGAEIPDGAAVIRLAYLQDAPDKRRVSW